MCDAPNWNHTFLTLLTSVMVATLLLAMDAPSSCNSCSQRLQMRPVALEDTLAESVQAGEALIAVLPEALDDRPVEAYQIYRAPALASIAGRSLLWVTRDADVGLHQIILSARIRGGDVDTLWVNVDVQ